MANRYLSKYGWMRNRRSMFGFVIEIGLIGKSGRLCAGTGVSLSLIALETLILA